MFKLFRSEMGKVFGLTMGVSLLFLACQIGAVVASLVMGLGKDLAMQTILDKLGASQLFLAIIGPFTFFIVVSLLMAIVAVFLAAQIGRLCGRDRLRQLSLLVLLLLWMTVLWENNRQFPGSQFSFTSVIYQLTGWNVSDSLGRFSAWYLWLITFFVVAVLSVVKHRRLHSGAAILLLPVLFVAAGVLGAAFSFSEAPRAQSLRPNVFIIGVDSLRYDIVGGMGAKYDLTPALSKQLEKAAVFPETYTPIARTYPSWIGILGGQYPIHSGARINLMPPALLHKKNLLPVVMREHGYKTVFAMDERRFSNIDESYGFDVALGPEMGIPDFLASTYDDFPLANILSASPLAKYLMPQHYANRPLSLTYRLSDYRDELYDELKKTGDKPLFLAAHFCLPHWPYVWGIREGDVVMAQQQRHYASAVQHADIQVSGLVQDLERLGYLDNAIVVFLSDHGEALNLDSDIPYTLDGKAMDDFVWGHGGTLLSTTQTRVVLGIAAYGKAAEMLQKGKYSGRATLLDVAPTLADMLGFPLTWPVDGRSLVGVMNGKETLGEEPVFFETELDLPTLNGIPNVARLITEGIGYYKVNDGRLELTDDAFQTIVAAKRRGVLVGDDLLEIAPNQKKGAKITMANLRSQQARKLTHAECIADDVCSGLMQKLAGFYGQEFSRIKMQ